jgi:hypothetical protein
MLLTRNAEGAAAQVLICMGRGLLSERAKWMRRREEGGVGWVEDDIAAAFAVSKTIKTWVVLKQST